MIETIITRIEITPEDFEKALKLIDPKFEQLLENSSIYRMEFYSNPSLISNSNSKITLEFKDKKSIERDYIFYNSLAPTIPSGPCQVMS